MSTTRDSAETPKLQDDDAEAAEAAEAADRKFVGHTESMRRLTDGAADPEWDRDRDLVDQKLRDPYEVPPDV